VSGVRIVADRDRCVGAGQCALAAPDVFDSGEDGLVVVLRPDAGASDAVLEAVDLCPASALSLHR
jgi:ferredoxin